MSVQHLDSGALLPAERPSRRLLLRAAWVGLAVNVLLTIGKFVGGIVGHSQAVIADAVHSFSDLATDIAVIVGVHYWSAPADANHPHGHARIETLVTVGIGLALAAVGIGIGWEALLGLFERDHTAAGFPALAAALVSIISKEILFRWTASVGHRVRSQALVANAWHHRSDALSSVPAALAVGIALIEPQLAFIDHLGAAVVCLFILHAAYRIAAPAVAELADHGAPEEERRALVQLALAVEGVRSAHAIRTRYTGSKLAVDLHVEVDGGLTVAEGYQIAQAVRRELIAHGPEVTDALVQVEPVRPRE